MRKWNFCAGPAVINEGVLKEAQKELLNWKKVGASVMEVSHRSKEFDQVASEARQDLIDILKIPENYEVLFLQGGATFQFSMLPMNFAHKGKPVAHIVSGTWSKKAEAEGSKISSTEVVASSADQNFTYAPEVQELNSDNYAYLHYAANETIHGVAYHQPPVSTLPLVSDMSSVILSEPMNIESFDFIYAGAQKNIGPAGLTIVIAKKEFLLNENDKLPNILRYTKHAENDSMLNTPPTFAWYLSGKVFKWIKGLGGLDYFKEQNHLKASTLYNYIDSTEFYSNPVNKSDRSIMNVPFIIHDSSLDSIFLEESKAAGLLNLKGHRSVGGMRASIYNAMPIEGINELIAFMKEFEAKHG